MSPVRRRLAWLLPTLLAMVLLAGVGAAVVLLRFPALVPAPSPRSVPVVRADVAAEIDVRGTVRSATEAGASFAVGGTVASVDVTPGTTVRAGDVLAMLDDSGARPRVQAASSALDADVRALSAARAAPVPDQVAIGRLTADVANDRAVLADAERVLADTVLRAPRDGTVTAVAGQVGDRVIAGTPSPDDAPSRRPFVSLADLGALVVRVAVPPREVPRVVPGQTATAVVDGAGPAFRGEVTAVPPVPGPDGTYAVTVTAASLPPTARVGQPADVRVTVARASSVLVVPTAALRVVGPDRGTVLVRRPDGDRVVTVATGLADAVAVEVRSGLAAGDLVVLPREDAA